MAAETTPRRKINNYLIGPKLGEGSFAKVHKARYLKPDGPPLVLACKILNLKKAPQNFVSKFFPRELEILRKIKHPYLVQIHNIIKTESRVMIFMNYAENGDLLDYIKSKGVVQEKLARLWFRQITSALKYLHNQDISHRDLKCENILLTKNYRALITDFGFSRYYTNEDDLSETYCGSISYAAPEIINQIPYNPIASDIWSLGVLLYVMLNAAMPFKDTDLQKLSANQKSKNFKFKAKSNPNAVALVQDILEPDLDKRCSLDHIISHPWLNCSTSS